MFKISRFCITLILSVVFISKSFANEGMLIPSLIAAFENDMKARGMKMTAADLYSVNNSSIKDAIIHFDGGCTAEIVSKKGLILTNHHCGYDEIQKHSSLQNDYLKFGFWAKNLSEELSNPGLTATRIVRIDDVTSSLKSLFGKPEFRTMINTLISDATRGTHYVAEIKAFDYGNAYYLMLKEVFTDVRLVGAPPSSIGKFGGDTDNWMWPRHTGDFSVFRIYAGKDNKPAAYSIENIPYTPLHSLPISMHNRKENDFTLVYGFPGQTEQHLVSSHLEYIINSLRPMQIDMRTKSLNVIDAAMRKSDAVRIQYSAKQSGIANSWKKWIGQIQGLKSAEAVQLKQNFENKYKAAARNESSWMPYNQALLDAIKHVGNMKNIDYAYSLTTEYYGNGPEFLRLASGVETFMNFVDTCKSKEKIAIKRSETIKNSHQYFKNYTAAVDKSIFDILSPAYLKYGDKSYLPKSLRVGSMSKLSETIYKKSFLTDSTRYFKFIKKYKSRKLKVVEGKIVSNGKEPKAMKDAGYLLYSEIIRPFRDVIIPQYQANRQIMNGYLKQIVEGKNTMKMTELSWPDANGTLRITYGVVEGSKPNPTTEFFPFTDVDGILEKHKTGNLDFELLPDLLAAYKQADWGQYAQNGKMLVCFTGSNHTTGGNSGSPVLNADGYLMGLNFDRSWESTMSDFLFNPNICRNVVVDIHYVLWVMDKYAGAGHLVAEMDLRR